MARGAGSLLNPNQLGFELPAAPQLRHLVARSGWRPPSELPSLNGVKRIAIDLETKDSQLRAMGPGFRRGAKIVGIAIGIDGGRRYYLPTGHAGGGNLDEGMVIDWAKEELGNFTGEVVGANLSYELDGLASCWDVHLNNVSAFHDVQVIEPLLDEDRFEYNLDALAKDYLGEGKDEALLLEAARHFGATTSETAKRVLWQLPAELVGPYAEGDVDRPLRMLPLQLKKIEAEDLGRVYNVERQLIPILVAMRRRGVRVNMEKVARLRTRFASEVKKWTIEVQRIAGTSKIELNDPASLAKALEDRGIVVPRTPKTGQPSVTKPFLERYQRDDLVRAVLNGRKFATLISTFLDSQIAGHQINGRVHPTFKQGRDDDGGSLARFAGTNPNLQFIPARESDWQEDQFIAPLVRGIFEPEPDEEWQRDDMSQIEFRLLVDCAVGQGAEEARQRYINDPKTDYHKFVAEMLKVDPEDKLKRKRVKNTNFAKGYGALAPKLADTFGCSVEEAEEFVKEYDRELPFSKATFDAAEKWAQKRGYVTTVLGRRRRFQWFGPAKYNKRRPTKLFRTYDEAWNYYIRDQTPYGKWPVRRIERADTYTALNGKLQGGCADMMKKSMVDGWNAGICKVLGPYLVTVHDELGNSVARTKIADEAGKELTRIMENAIKIKVPVIVERDRGADWGACS